MVDGGGSIRKFYEGKAEVVVEFDRKVYKVSGDSWVVTVPIEWVRALEARGAKKDGKGYRVKVSVLSDGSLLVIPVTK